MKFANCSPQGKENINEPSKISYKTLQKRIKDLMDENWLSKNIFPESSRPIYYIPKSKINRVKELIEKKRFYSLAESFSPEWFSLFRKFVYGVEKFRKTPEEFFKEHCIAFIANIPCSFQKSIEGMQSHLYYEKRIEKLAEKNGISKEEQFRKMMEDAEKKEGIEKLIIGLGLNREEIEKMGGSVGPVTIFRKGKEIGKTDMIIIKKEEKNIEKK